MPTTLLAQVDSSVGGKTAVNHPGGKNLIGAFHQPHAVLADTEVLRTLPDRELHAGLAEVIKYGLICDAAFFDWLEHHLEALLAREPEALGHAIGRSCEIKAEIVERDEREQGERALLNLGHTFGHAIEAATGYVEWLHGEAVGTGMLIAADLSARLGQPRRRHRVAPALIARASEAPDRGTAHRRRPRARLHAGRQEGAVGARAAGAARRLGARSRSPASIRMPRCRRRSRLISDEQRARSPSMPHRNLKSRGRRYPEPPPQYRSEYPARSRPHHPFQCLPAAGVQDPGVRQSRGRSVPHPRHAFDRGGTDRPHHRPRAGAQRDADRGDFAWRTISGIRLSATPGRTRSTTACAITAASSTICSRCAPWMSSRSATRCFPGLNLTFECREGILKHCSLTKARELGELGERFLLRRQPEPRGAAGESRR